MGGFWGLGFPGWFMGVFSSGFLVTGDVFCVVHGLGVCYIGLGWWCDLRVFGFREG